MKGAAPSAAEPDAGTGSRPADRPLSPAGQRPGGVWRDACGKCKSAELLFRTRKNAQNNEFFELLCGRCRAVLQLGVHKLGGTLFPRRHRDSDGGEKEWLPDNGWVRWDPESERMV